MTRFQNTRAVRTLALAAAGCTIAFATARAPAAPATTAVPAGLRTEHITDPTLNGMVAYEVVVPAKWHFQATLGQGGHCVPVPFQVFRATSPDGLSFVERMPVLAWTWGTGPAANTRSTDCLPLKEAIHAQDFLRYVATLLKVEYVADEPVPAAENASAQRELANGAAQYAPLYARSNMIQPTSTRELARATVRYRNGSFVMKGLLQGTVDCSESSFPGQRSVLQGMPDRPPWHSDQCRGGVRYTVAPEGQWAGVLAEASKVAATATPAWTQAWIQRNQRQAAAFSQQMAAATSAAMAASAAQFNHDQAVRQQMHEQFLATMQRGTDQSMARAAQIANSNHTIASDWVDYSLNQQTVRDPGTGQVRKVASGYNATWVDSSGKTSFQTTDPSANPNGTLPGTWTRQQVVHGDGSN